MSLDYSTRAERLLKGLVGYDPKTDPRVVAQDVQKLVEALFYVELAGEKVLAPAEEKQWSREQTFDLSGDCTVEDYRRITEGYLNSFVAMSLFSELTLLRASRETARVVVKKRGGSLRVSLLSSSGNVKHFNRDGKP